MPRSCWGVDEMKVKAIDSSQKTLKPLEERASVMDAVQKALDLAIEKLDIGVECEFRRETLELVESRARKESDGTAEGYVKKLASLSAHFFIIGYCQKLLGTEAQAQLEKEIHAGLVEQGVKLPAVR